MTDSILIICISYGYMIVYIWEKREELSTVGIAYVFQQKACFPCVSFLRPETFGSGRF